MRSKRTAAVCGLLTILMTLSIACFPERAEAVGFPTAEAWLVIDTLYCKVDDARPGKDTFLLKGYFHWEPGSFDPAASDVTIAIDNHVITIPADQWKKRGTSKFKAKYANVSAQIDYWVKGSGRCNFIFVGTRQDMAPNVPNLPDMPVRIVVSPSVDITVFVSMKEFGRVWKMDEADSLPSFAIDKMQVKRNPKTASKDAYKVWGRVFLPRDFDPSIDGIYLSLETMEVQISPGEIVMPASGKTLRFNKTFPDGKKILLTLNNQTRKILIFVSNVDLSGLADPPLARFAIPTLANAMWGFVIHLEQANKAGTLLKF